MKLVFGIDELVQALSDVSHSHGEVRKGFDLLSDDIGQLERTMQQRMSLLEEKMNDMWAKTNGIILKIQEMNERKKS